MLCLSYIWSCIVLHVCKGKSWFHIGEKKSCTTIVFVLNGSLCNSIILLVCLCICLDLWYQGQVWPLSMLNFDLYQGQDLTFVKVKVTKCECGADCIVSSRLWVLNCDRPGVSVNVDHQHKLVRNKSDQEFVILFTDSIGSTRIFSII